MNYKFGVLAIIAAHISSSAAGPRFCVCGKNLQPVCGSNGITYDNRCMLVCEQSKSNSNLTIAYEGPCLVTTSTDNCSCGLEHAPVCGTDGNTYLNACVLDCRRHALPSLRLSHEGQCRRDEAKAFIELPSCTCKMEMDPVCGTDGNTYSSLCLLNCSTPANPRLTLRHPGPCEISEQVPQRCSCNRRINTVCASDGVTYMNECLMRCKGGRHLTVLKDGFCDY